MMTIGGGTTCSKICEGKELKHRNFVFSSFYEGDHDKFWNTGCAKTIYFSKVVQVNNSQRSEGMRRQRGCIPAA